MHYTDGAQIKLGDRIKLANGEAGTIVFSIDSNEYSNEFPKKDWDYLKAGVMVRTDSGALIHLQDPNANDIVRL